MNQRRQNNTFVGARMHYGSREADLAAYDALPLEIKRVLAENATKLSAESVVKYGLSLLRQGASSAEIVQHLIRKIVELERNEIDVFSGRHKAQYGYELPHVAAGATIQRYGT